MRSFLFTTVSVAAVAIGAGLLIRQRPGAVRSRIAPQEDRSHPLHPTAVLENGLSAGQVRSLTRNFLLYYVIPLWLAAGIADWYCHRATHIAETTGTKETLLHLAQLVEMGVPTLAGLFLEINSPVLALMVASFLLHEATAMWDVSYAVSRRDVTPVEQHVHSFLEMLPLMALSFVGLLHWPQVKALVGVSGEADWTIRLKRDPLPAGYIVTLLGAIAALELSPYLEELWRDWKAHPNMIAPPADEAAAARTKQHEWA